jgi:hypothetical protein
MPLISAFVTSRPDSTLERQKQVKMRWGVVGLVAYQIHQKLWRQKFQIIWFASPTHPLYHSYHYPQSFMHRLKFQYLENNAKDKYVKTIVNDEAPMITADTNATLQAANLVKKANLKAAKSSLAQRHTDIRNLAPCVEQGEELYHNCLGVT